MLVRRVQRREPGLLLHTDEDAESCDQVVLALHSGQALAILIKVAASFERRTLGVIRYASYRPVLYTDPALLPRYPTLWLARNSLLSAQELDQRPVSVPCLNNRLQPLSFRTPLMVSLNMQREPRGGRVIAEFDYAHPIFDGLAIAAQSELPTISGASSIWFSGAWSGYGFHDDGSKSPTYFASTHHVRHAFAKDHGYRKHRVCCAVFRVDSSRSSNGGGAGDHPHRWRADGERR